MADNPPLDRPAELTDKVSFAHVQAVVNAASGSVGPDGAEKLRTLLERFGIKAEIADAEPSKIVEAVAEAVARKPDVLIILAGDGTAGLAARSCGPDGPVLMPLAGGTMNMLPFALYGKTDWETALERTLREGFVHTVSGGEVDGQPFYVAAILGAPALWAKAREAVRMGDLRRAWMRAVHALKNAFAGQLRYSLAGGPRLKTEALTLMCPLVSTAVDEDTRALEAAVLNVENAAEAMRLGFNMMTGDWRRDPSVEVKLIRTGRAWLRGGRMPALLDGESTRFDHSVEFRFVPRAFRALVPPPLETSAA